MGSLSKDQKIEKWKLFLRIPSAYELLDVRKFTLEQAVIAATKFRQPNTSGAYYKRKTADEIVADAKLFEEYLLGNDEETV